MDQQIKTLKLEQLFEEVKLVSEQLEELTGKFTYNKFQAYVAAHILSDHRNMKVSILRTGSGKSFVAMILALYYHNLGKKVVIVTSQSFLVTQMRYMMGHLRQKVEVL